jgi:hypothetical protein
VYVEVNKKCKLQGERVETPRYIIDNNLKIDYLFYITNQIMKPSMQFLELIAHNAEQVFKMYIIREENRKSGVEPIMKYFADQHPEGAKINSIELTMASGDDLFGKAPPKTRHSAVRSSRDRTKSLFKK